MIDNATEREVLSVSSLVPLIAQVIITGYITATKYENDRHGINFPVIWPSIALKSSMASLI